MNEHGGDGRLIRFHALDGGALSCRLRFDLGAAAVQRVRVGMVTYQAFLLSPALPSLF